MTSSLTAHPATGLTGRDRVPGDKSISHRSLILGGLATGRTRVSGLLEADDVLRTASAVRALGARVERDGEDWVIDGAPWQAPAQTLYLGNAGTGSRLLMGAVAGQGVAARFEGDLSLRSRPMGRIVEPLTQMGAVAETNDGRLPVALAASSLSGIRYRLPKPSAQIKSAILLAALGATGETIIEEPVPSRDHTERMLPAFGVPLIEEEDADGCRLIRLTGPATLSGTTLRVPGDPSSAAFPVVAGLVVAGSSLVLGGVLMNPHRVGLYRVLEMMGAAIAMKNERVEGGESVADIHVEAAQLRGVSVPAVHAPSMIDEYPILAVAAAFADGTTRMEGLGELRVKESDRLDATAALLRLNGVVCRTGEDWLEVDGGLVPGGGTVPTHHDHRIGMAALVLGLGAQQAVAIDDAGPIATSFPTFTDLMGSFGARFG